MEEEKILDIQYSLYRSSNFLFRKWYRKLYGGKWRLLKFGRDTPYVRLFATWSKTDPEEYDGYTKVIDTEEYPITNVDTRFKLIKQFFKNFFSK